jgi:hypothetical protein
MWSVESIPEDICKGEYETMFTNSFNRLEQIGKDLSSISGATSAFYKLLRDMFSKTDFTSCGEKDKTVVTDSVLLLFLYHIPSWLI